MSKWVQNKNGVLIPSREAGFIQPGIGLMNKKSGGGGPVYSVWDATKIPSSLTRTSSTLLTGGSGIGHYASAGSTVGKSSGKWLFQTTGSNNDYFSGIACLDGTNSPWTNSNALGYDNIGAAIAVENYNGEIYACLQSTSQHINTSTGAHAGSGAVLTIAVDLDGNKVSIFVGNTAGSVLSIPSWLLGKTWYPSVSILYSGATVLLNAGQTTITVPTPLAGLGYTPYWA